MLLEDLRVSLPQKSTFARGITKRAWRNDVAPRYHFEQCSQLNLLASFRRKPLPRGTLQSPFQGLRRNVTRATVMRLLERALSATVSNSGTLIPESAAEDGSFSIVGPTNARGNTGNTMAAEYPMPSAHTPKNINFDCFRGFR